MKTYLAAIALVLCASIGFSMQTSGKPSAASTTTTSTALKKLKPGDPCHTNTDGVTACNTGRSGSGDMTIDPQTGTNESATTVCFKNNATGSASGIDGNDIVNVANGANATISGTGGTVNVSPGSNGTVKNTNAAGGASITVNMGGGSISVSPGSTITFSG